MTDKGHKKTDNSSTNNMSVITEAMLQDARNSRFPAQVSYSVPISQLATLGGAVAEIIPQLKTVAQVANANGAELYQLANAGAGDVLKAAKNGNFWAAFKTADGASKLAQLKPVNPAGVTKINPAMLLMAVALYSIEKELGNIADIQHKIVSFLQNEKEAEIEADVITLTEIITKYKYNWDNDRYIASNHKMICDLQRTSRKNMISFQKSVSDELSSKQFLVADSKIDITLKEMLKKFKYYRLSVYIFALSSLVEIMLSGNFLEDNIKSSIDEIEKNSKEYRSLFTQCSKHLEKLSRASIKGNLLNGVGSASDAVGKFIGSIPMVKDGQVDEFLIGQGKKIKKSVTKDRNNIIESFSKVKSPNTRALVEKLNDMIQIYNHTNEICCDNESVFLIQ